MQTARADFIKGTPEGSEADAILRKCVHCGFCTATCPTYLLLGDENDGPRGRIYLMKQALEGQPVTDKTRLHLDRCLTCRACETTCPSGVQYGRLLDIGRKLVEEKTSRPRRGRFQAAAARRGVSASGAVRAPADARPSGAPPSSGESRGQDSGIGSQGRRQARSPPREEDARPRRLRAARALTGHQRRG